jgi:hypothetical protein
LPNAKGMSCELYRKANRYITITGNQIGSAAELINIDTLIDRTLADLDGGKQEKPSNKGTGQGARPEHDLDSLIKDGCGEDFDGDRSRAVWFVMNDLLRQGKTADEIVAVLLDRRNGISAQIYDQSQPERYAKKQVEDAQRKQAKDLDAEITRLTQLSTIPYERERKPAAKRLGLRPTILDKLVQAERQNLGLRDADNGKQGHAISLPEPEPWADRVDGAELLDDITAALKRYVVMAEHEARTSALWCVHTYLLDCFFISPRLAIRSPMHRCGKTTLLDVISHLALRTLPTANVTAAAIFRVIEACRPTLLIDEADTFLPGAEDLRGVINSGHRQGGSVIRTVGEDHEPRRFSTYGALAIALIGKLPATLHDRSAPTIELKRRLRNEAVESFRLDQTGHLDLLARKIARWTADHANQIRDIDPKLPAGLFNRDADNWRSLLAIGEVAGGKWPEQAREAAALCCAVAGVEDAAQLELLLGDIRDVFDTKQADASTSVDEITSAVLVDRLVEIEGHPWAEMGRSQKHLTQNRLARMLKPLGICPEKVGPEEKRLQGYKRERFEDAFTRYLPAEGAFKVDIRTEPHETGTSEHFQSGQPDRGCLVEKLEKPNNDGLLSTCPVAKGGAGERTMPYNLPTHTGRAHICAHCDRPGGNQVSFGDALIWLHRECEERYRAANDA